MTAIYSMVRQLRDSQLRYAGPNKSVNSVIFCQLRYILSTPLCQLRDEAVNSVTLYFMRFFSNNFGMQAIEL